MQKLPRLWLGFGKPAQLYIVDIILRKKLTPVADNMDKEK